MQITCYAGVAARYKPHLDNMGGAQSDGRLLSLVCYLNDEWNDEDGGALRIHLPSSVAGAAGLQPEKQTPFVDVYPRLGTIAVFRSDRVLHEVRPPKRSRYAVTVWLVADNPSHANACYF